MAYQVIARKWRPQTFRDLTGQTHVTETLANAIRNDRVAHAYIFSGARGVGMNLSLVRRPWLVVRCSLRVFQRLVFPRGNDGPLTKDH